MNEYALSLDLGGTKCAGALIDSDGSIVVEDTVKLEGRVGAEVGMLICEHASLFMEKSLRDESNIKGIGVSVPGISYQDTGRVWAPNIPGWDDYPLYEELSKLSGRNTRVVIDSDRACCILAETWLGTARGSKHAIFLAVGTGIGAGILIDGRILRGAQDIAGAIGWMALETEYRELYEKFGCFEYHASGDGLVREALDRLKEKKDSKNAQDFLKNIDAPLVFELYEKNDPLAVEVIDKAVRLWGKAVANLVSLFNPETIIFGGGVFGPAAGLIIKIEQEARRWAQPISMQHVRLVPSALKEKAALYGAARLIFTS